MTQSQSLFTRSAAVKWLFAAGLVTIPFDAIRGIGAFGELGNELSFPFFGAAIALAVVGALRSGERTISSSLALRVAVAILAVILLSLIVNLPEIGTTVFRERTGGNKFATSLLVVIYGLGLAWLAEQADPRDYPRLLARFICWSVLISILYILIELAGRAGMLGGLFRVIDNIVHTRQADVVNPWDGSINQKIVEGWDARYRSVSFEPPAFGNYTGFAWPWVWYAALKAEPARKLRAWTLLTIFSVIIVVAASRTGLLMLLVNCALIGTLALVYARPGTNSEAGAAARLLLPVALVGAALVGGAYAVSNFTTVVNGVVSGDSVSDLSRLAFQTAAAKMFVSHPIFGVGLGQFGFHVVEYLPDWAYRSPEIPPMVTYPLAPWPNVYSIYARIGAELGLIGLIGWCGLWLGLAGLLAARARVDRPASGIVSPYYPVILNCIGVLVSGFTTDTFRTPMMWVALGLGCGLLIRARAGRRAALSPAAVAAE